MIKKVFSAIVCFVTAGVLVACVAGSSSVKFEERKAWQLIASSSTNREYIAFDAERFSFVSNQKTQIALGELTFSLKENSLGNAELNTSMRLNHNSNSNFASMTDAIDSTALFKSATLSPISSTKTLSLASGTGYQTVTDYVERTTKIIPISEGELDTAAQRNYSLRSGAYFDNETLYHLVRAIPNLDTGKNYTFNIVTPFDIYANKGFMVHKIEISVASDLTRQIVPKSIFDMAIARAEGDPGKINNDGSYEIDSYLIRIKLDAEKSGPAFYMYLSALNFLDNELLAGFKDIYTSKVPLKIITAEYDLNNNQTFSNEYTIKAYSTVQ